MRFPWTSALFLYTGQVTIDKVTEAIGGEIDGELIQSNLSNEEEAKLKEHFSLEV